MSSETVQEQFDKLGVWARGGQRAPHKPLLVLYALGKWARGESEQLYFADAEADLTLLLKEFGPSRRSHHPEYPFWWLQNDGVWVVQADGTLKPRKAKNNPPKRELLAQNAWGMFSAEVRDAFRASPVLVTQIATRLLEQHFPESLHNDILESVGLSLDTSVTQRKRDPKFRLRVLTAYEYRCAVCGFDVRLGSVSIAIDAAHIQWHQAGGPDLECNGLALCVLHHKTFDLGVFTVNNGVLLVSDQANGTAGFQESLMIYHGKPIRSAQRPNWWPEPKYLAWHKREVFKGEARHRNIPI